MRQPGKLKRWLLRRLGGVPQSEYNIVCEQRDTFIGDIHINDRLIKSLEAENKQLTEQLQRVLLSIDAAKEMNAMCNVDEQRKQAVEEFAEWIKDNITNVPFCNQKAYNVFCDMVNEKLKEIKQ